MNISAPVVYSSEEYKERTGHYGRDISFAYPKFSIEDIQEYLINRGYIIVFHEYKQKMADHSNGSVQNYVVVKTDMFAVRPEQILILPNVFSPEEAIRYDAISTFRTLLKKKLLEL